MKPTLWVSVMVGFFVYLVNFAAGILETNHISSGLVPPLALLMRDGVNIGVALFLAVVIARWLLRAARRVMEPQPPTAHAVEPAPEAEESIGSQEAGWRVKKASAHLPQPPGPVIPPGEHLPAARPAGGQFNPLQRARRRQLVG